MEKSRLKNGLIIVFAITIACSAEFSKAIESPEYRIVHSESDFEIRHYRESVWMVAPVNEISFEKATRNGFHRYPFPHFFFICSLFLLILY